MICLALDTATEACSAALLDGDTLYQRYELAPRGHGERILPMLDAVLNDAGRALGDCDLLAFGRGPGAFTGLRIAAGVAQGVAFAAALPVAPVSDLAALALYAARERRATRIAAAIDARMGEVYWGLFAAEAGPAGAIVRPLCAEQVSAPEAVIAADAEDGAVWYGVGSGWAVYRDMLSSRVAAARIDAERYPRAAEIARLGVEAAIRGDLVGAAEALPVYLRDRVVGR